jgi:ATP-dependent Clp protease protease subunit
MPSLQQRTINMSATTEQDLNEKTPGQKLQDSGMYVFMDEVNSESIRPVIEWILCENFVNKKKRKELLLMICSEGGDVSAAFALIDVMRSSNIFIKTVGLGSISSAGLLIFLAGSPGRRILTPNTSILSHQFSWGSDGKAHELFATMREFELTHQRMVDHYKLCTKLDEDIIKKSLLPPHDVWLSAKEALDLNICDAISELTR